MKNIFSIRTAYFFTAAGVFIYLILRAIHVPPVHDEAATYLHYVQRFEWMPYKAHWDANNHILNSLLSGIIFKIFGQGLWQLRLASLLFFPVYVFYVWRISGFLKNKVVQISFLAGMLLVHNLMEYYAYSRGYAMSMALLMGALYYALNYFKDFELRKLWLFYLLAMLALSANLTLVNTVLIINGVLCLSFLVKNKQWGTKLFYTLIGIAPIALVGILSMDMKKMGLLYYGDDSGFWSLTVWSLVILIYDSYQEWIAIFFTVMAVTATVFLLLGKTNTGLKERFFTNHWLVAALFLGNIIAIFLLQWILGVNYPEDRTAMYLYFLLVLFFCFTLDKLKGKRIKFLGLIWLTAPLHFAFNINTTHSAYWYYEHIPYSFYKEVEQRAGDHPEQVSIGGYKLMTLIWAYYNQMNGGKLNDMQKEDYPSFYYDYLFLYDDNNLAFAKEHYDVVAVDPYSNIHLLERKQKIEKRLIATFQVPDVVSSEEEFIGFYESDTLGAYTNFCFEVDANFQNPNDFCFGIITLGINSGGKEVIHYNQELHYSRPNWKKGYRYQHSIHVQNAPKDGERYILYLWNKYKLPITVSDISVKIYTW